MYFNTNILEKSIHKAASPIRDADLLNTLYAFIYTCWKTNDFASFDNPDVDYSNYMIAPYYKMSDQEKKYIFESFQNIIVTYEGKKYIINNGKIYPYEKTPINNPNLVDNNFINKVKDLLNKFNPIPNDLTLDDLDALMKLINALIDELHSYPMDTRSYYIPKLKALLRDLLQTNPTPVPSYATEWNKIVDFQNRYRRITESWYSYLDFLGDDTAVKYNDIEQQRLDTMLSCLKKLTILDKDIEKSNIRSILLMNLRQAIREASEDAEYCIYYVLSHLQDYCLYKHPSLQTNLKQIISRYISQYAYIINNNLINQEYQEKLEKNHSKVLNIYLVKEELKVRTIKASIKINEIADELYKNINAINSYFKTEAPIEDYIAMVNKLSSIKRDLLTYLDEDYTYADTEAKNNLNQIMHSINTLITIYKDYIKHAMEVRTKVTTTDKQKQDLIDILLLYITNTKDISRIMENTETDKVVIDALNNVVKLDDTKSINTTVMKHDYDKVNSMLIYDENIENLRKFVLNIIMKQISLQNINKEV